MEIDLSVDIVNRMIAYCNKKISSIISKIDGINPEVIALLDDCYNNSYPFNTIDQGISKSLKSIRATLEKLTFTTSNGKKMGLLALGKIRISYSRLTEIRKGLLKVRKLLEGSKERDIDYAERIRYVTHLK